MFRLAVTMTLARRRRYALASLAAALGVALLAGSLMLVGTLQRSFDNLAAGTWSGIDLVVRGQLAAPGSGGPGSTEVRPPVDPDLVNRVRGRPGIAAATGVVEGYADVVGADGLPVGTSTTPTVGSSWIDDPTLTPYRIAQGRPPQRRGEVALDRLGSRRAGLGVGATTRVLTAAGSEPVVVTGIVAAGSADSSGTASAVLFDDATARRLLSPAGADSRVVASTTPGVDVGDVAARLQADLGPGVEVATGERLRQENADGVAQALGPLRVLFLAIAVLVGAVAAVVVSNALTVLAAQRTRESALLRLLGATRRQVATTVLVDGLVTGVFGATAGAVAGVGIAAGLLFVLARIAPALGSAPLLIDAGSLGLAWLTGVALCLVAARGAARRAMRTAPIAALRHAELRADDVTPARRRVVAGLSLVGVVTALASRLADDPGLSALTAASAGVLLTLALVAAGPAVVRRAAPILGSSRMAGPLALAAAVSGTVALAAVVRRSWFEAAAAVAAAGALASAARIGSHGVAPLAVGACLRRPRRIAAAGTALGLGLLVVCALTVVTTSLTRSLTGDAERELRADVVVSGRNVAGYSQATTRLVTGLPEVAASTPVRQIPARASDEDVTVSAVDTQVVEDLVDLRTTQGRTADIRVGTIGLSRETALRWGVSVGDVVDVVSAQGRRQALAVRAVYDNDALLGPAIVDVTTGTALDPAALDSAAFLRLRSGVEVVDFLERARPSLAISPDAVAMDRSSYGAERLGGFAPLVMVLQALVAFAGLVGAVGLLNTLSLSLVEREPELAVARAIGMTGRQTRSLIAWEAVIVAGLAALLGIEAGTTIGAALTTAIGLPQVSIPFGPLGAISVAGVATGLAAAWLPARRAARLAIVPGLTGGVS